MKKLRVAVWASLFAVSGLGGCKKEAADRPAGIPPSTTAPAPTAAPPPAPAANEAEMVPAAPDPGQTIGGSIVLPAAR
jgi:hypothetical protein